VRRRELLHPGDGVLDRRAARLQRGARRRSEMLEQAVRGAR
jgi:hypothetical protein